MRNRIVWLALALLAALVLAGTGEAQPPGKKGPGKKGAGKKGRPAEPFARAVAPGAGLFQVVDDLKLAETKRETAKAAVKTYQDNVRRLTQLCDAGLLLTMKENLSQTEFTQFKEAKDRPPSRPTGLGGRRPAAEGVVERILSFDKNKDGKVTKEELPERMHDLLARGDTNKDGALDRDEIRKLAPAQSKGGRGPGGRFPPGRKGPAGAGRDVAPTAPPIERAVNDLKLSGTKKETATAAVKAHQENVRKVTELARAELLLKMNDLLNEEQFKKFKAAVDRPSQTDRPPPRRPGRGN